MAIYRSGFGPGGDKTRLTDRLDHFAANIRHHMQNAATIMENHRKDTLRND
jgi:hypothetical protein